MQQVSFARSLLLGLFCYHVDLQVTNGILKGQQRHLRSVLVYEYCAVSLHLESIIGFKEEKTKNNKLKKIKKNTVLCRSTWKA